MPCVYKAAFKFALGVAVVLGAIFGVLRGFFLVPVTITDDGNAPTLLAGETVYMWKSSSHPDFGDLVVCRHPRENAFVVGRFVARPGHQLHTDRERLYLNGRRPDRDIQGRRDFIMAGEQTPHPIQFGVEVLGGEEHYYMEHADRGAQVAQTTVREGIFLLGDNRLHHNHDSRAFGPVNPATCVGEIFMRIEISPHRNDFDHAVLDLID